MVALGYWLRPRKPLIWSWHANLAAIDSGFSLPPHPPILSSEGRGPRAVAGVAQAPQVRPFEAQVWPVAYRLDVVDVRGHGAALLAARVGEQEGRTQSAPRCVVPSSSRARARVRTCAPPARLLGPPVLWTEPALCVHEIQAPRFSAGTLRHVEPCTACSGGSRRTSGSDPCVALYRVGGWLRSQRTSRQEASAPPWSRCGR